MQDSNPTDDQLIVRIKRNDKKAFQILFERYFKVLLASAVNMLKDIDAAKDVTQDVFLKLWNKRATLNIPSPPIAYLKRAVINQALNQIKSKKRFVADDELISKQSEETTAIETLKAQDLSAVMKKALDTLPEGCRTIFVMRRLEGMRVKEIAEQLAISPKTVENQLTKALKVLKNAIQPYVKENSS